MDRGEVRAVNTRDDYRLPGQAAIAFSNDGRSPTRTMSDPQMHPKSRAVRRGGNARNRMRAKSERLASTDGNGGRRVRAGGGIRGRTGRSVRRRHGQWRTARASRGRAFRTVLHLQVGSGCRRSGPGGSRAALDGRARALRGIRPSRVCPDGARARRGRLHDRRSPREGGDYQQRQYCRQPASDKSRWPPGPHALHAVTGRRSDGDMGGILCSAGGTRADFELAEGVTRDQIEPNGSAFPRPPLYGAFCHLRGPCPRHPHCATFRT
jgi:hypothetical protein